MSAPGPTRPQPARRARRAPVLIACVIGLLLALGFAYGAWVLASDHLHMVAVGRITDGTIVGYKTVRHTNAALERHVSSHQAGVNPSGRLRISAMPPANQSFSTGRSS